MSDFVVVDVVVDVTDFSSDVTGWSFNALLEKSRIYVFLSFHSFFLRKLQVVFKITLTKSAF